LPSQIKNCTQNTTHTTRNLLAAIRNGRQAFVQRSFVQRSETPRDNPPGLRATLWLGSPGFCATLWDGQSTRPAIVHCFETVARSVVNNARDNQSGPANNRAALWNGTVARPLCNALSRLETTREAFVQRFGTVVRPLCKAFGQLDAPPGGLRTVLWDGHQAFVQRSEKVNARPPEICSMIEVFVYRHE
jgi:hypothetical protein